MRMYLVIVVKIDPAAQALDSGSPLRGVTHDDSAALFIVFVNAKLLHGSFAGDAQLLVDLVLDGEAMGIPTKSALNMVSLHRPVAGNNVFDRGGEKMAIVRQTRSKGRSIVEGVAGEVGCQLELANSLVSSGF